jgi:hypothetical protein
MIKPTRRGFLAQASFGSAAILATLTGCANNAQSPDASGLTALATSSSSSGATMSEPLVAYINNSQTGEIILLAGAQEFVLHDTELVKRFLDATH